MQIVWPTTPHGWQFGIAGPNAALLVTGGAAAVAAPTLNICKTTVVSLMPRRTVEKHCP